MSRHSLRLRFTAALKLGLVGLWLLAIYGVLWVARLFKKPSWRDRIIHICNHGLMLIIGIRLTVTGKLAEDRPLMLVTNHVSYLDIILIAACATVKFTPKSEIGGWPFVGSFSRLCDSVFIDRRPEKVGEMKTKLHDALDAGDVVCLFPEATTGDGLKLKEFKSGFFNLANEDFSGRALKVQPAAVVYTQIGGLPVGRTQWPLIAWYGDMELGPHVWEMLMLPGIAAEIIFLPPLEGKNRKALAAACQEAVAHAIEEVRQRPKNLAAPKPKCFNPRNLRKA